MTKFQFSKHCEQVLRGACYEAIAAAVDKQTEVIEAEVVAKMADFDLSSMVAMYVEKAFEDVVIEDVVIAAINKAAAGHTEKLLTESFVNAISGLAQEHMDTVSRALEKR